MPPRHHDPHRTLRTPLALIAGLLFVLLAVQSLCAQSSDLRRIEAVADSLAHDDALVFAAGDGPAASLTLHLGNRAIPGARK